jgi:3',5'-cyclic-AMP phosphodiesterase
MGAGGRLGAAHLKWLNQALDARPDKPALVFCHHNLQDKPDRDGGYFGLADSADLWPALVARKQVKAFFFGHTHGFHVTKRDGLHTVNLPATGYHPNRDAFLGWLDAALHDDRLVLRSHGLDEKHAKHGKTFELPYR